MRQPYWLEEFGELEDTPEIREAFGTAPAILTDAEIARIQARSIARNDVVRLPDPTECSPWG